MGASSPGTPSGSGSAGACQGCTLAGVHPGIPGQVGPVTAYRQYRASWGCEPFWGTFTSPLDRQHRGVILIDLDMVAPSAGRVSYPVSAVSRRVPCQMWRVGWRSVSCRPVSTLSHVAR